VSVALTVSTRLAEQVGVTSGAAIPFEPRSDEVRRAIVLSGGGARGAYEAGVMRFVLGELPRRLGWMPRFDVYSGTSVGAVHTCHLAAMSDDPEAGVRALVEVWRNMSFSTVYRFGVGDAYGFSKSLLGFLTGRSSGADEGKARVHGLLDTGPLEQLVVDGIPWQRMRKNRVDGRFSAVCVSTTEIATGRTVTFVDHDDRSVPTWTNDSLHIARAARIAPEHALASAAIPFLFPAVRIGDTYFCDGSLRQQTPLAPALRLGSNRVLVVGLRHGRPPSLDDPLAAERIERMHSAGFLFGKVLNALLIDRLEYDLGQMRVMNRVLRAGIELWGDDYLDRINVQVKKERGLGFRVVEDCLIRPSEDIGSIAARHVERVRSSAGRSWLGSLAFGALTRGSPSNEADLMSYLLFDGEYAAELIDLGYRDAEAMEADLFQFFSS
jgi:NTE family protein